MVPSDLDYHRLLLNWKAAILLGISAVLSLGAIVLINVHLNWNGLSSPEWQALSFAGAAAAVGVVSLLAGMWIYWAKCDDSSKRSRTLWFLALFLGFSYGAIPYYLFVYIPAVRGRWPGQDSHRG